MTERLSGVTILSTHKLIGVIMAVGTNKIWVCMVCGYIHQGEMPPDVCPVCGALAEQFEEMSDEFG